MWYPGKLRGFLWPIDSKANAWAAKLLHCPQGGGEKLGVAHWPTTTRETSRGNRACNWRAMRQRILARIRPRVTGAWSQVQLEGGGGQ